MVWWRQTKMLGATYPERLMRTKRLHAGVCGFVLVLAAAGCGFDGSSVAVGDSSTDDPTSLTSVVDSGTLFDSDPVEPERPSREAPAPQIGDGIGDAEMQDLETLASVQGMTVEEAIARYAWNDNFAVAVERIQAVDAGEFNSAGIKDASTAWVGFVDEPSHEALEIIEEFNEWAEDFGVRAEILSQRGFSEAELEGAVVAVHEALYESPMTADVSTAADPEHGIIESRVDMVEGGSADDELHLERVANDLSAGFDVELTFHR